VSFFKSVESFRYVFIACLAQVEVQCFSLVVQGYCIDFSMLKEKYHPQRNKGASKIRSYCKDIEKYTNAKIKVDIPQRADHSRRDVRFEIQGQTVAVQRAVQSIQGEFIFRKVSYRCNNLFTILVTMRMTIHTVGGLLSPTCNCL